MFEFRKVTKPIVRSETQQDSIYKKKPRICCRSSTALACYVTILTSIAFFILARHFYIAYIIL